MSDYTPEVLIYALAHGVDPSSVEANDSGLAEVRDWLAAHDAEIRADAWDECLDDIEGNELNTGQARAGNPYRTPRAPAPELIPGVQAAVDALSIYRKG